LVKIWTNITGTLRENRCTVFIIETDCFLCELWIWGLWNNWWCKHFAFY